METDKQKQTIIFYFEPFARLQDILMDRLSLAPFQNGTDCLLLQLIQPHRRHSTSSWMPYRPTSGRVGSLSLGCPLSISPLRDTPLAVTRQRFCRVADKTTHSPSIMLKLILPRSVLTWILEHNPKRDHRN